MNTDESHFAAFVTLLREAQDADELASLLRALLTPAELKEIPKRLQITRMLLAGMPQRDIAKQLGVGIATVTRGSKALADIAELLEGKNGNSKT